MSETSPITEQANPETELARDRCSPEDLPHDALQTIPRTEPVVQVLEQINAELENLSVGAGRTQVEEEDVVNDSGRLVKPDAGGSSSGGLKCIPPSMTRGFPFPVSSLKPVGQAFENIALSEREAWDLFMEELGHDIALSPEVERIAVYIARECAGFPLGIITLARSLRGVDDQDEWRNALNKLNELKSRDKVDDVFWMLRFSYDRLDDVALQQCLLYCALFPKGHEIEREELIGYLIDRGIIENMWSMLGEYKRGHAMLDRLENAGLLERIDGGRAVKMDDLVRDMAVRIRKENPSVMEQRRKGIEMAPFKSGWTATPDDQDELKKLKGSKFRKMVDDFKSRLTGEVSASAREQNSVDKAQQREPLLTREFERANDLTGAGIELPPDTPDDQDELKKLKGSKSRDMVDDFESGLTGAVSASAREQNNVDMAQQRETLLTGEFERANDLTGARIELPPDTSDDQEPLFLALDSVHHVDRIVPPTIDENYNRREATERLVQPGVGASSFGVYGNRNAQKRESFFTGEYEWAKEFFGGIELGLYTPEANPETEFARDHCSPEEQVGFQGMEQGEEEGRVCSHLDMENNGEGSVQHVDRIVPPTIDENYNRREATEILVQPSVAASAFVFYGDIDAISTSQQENVAGDEETTPAAATMEEDEDEEPGEDEELLGPGRKRIKMASSNIDRFWNDVEQMNDGGNSTHKTMVSCSPEDLPHDALQTIPRTEPVVQVQNLSVGAGRTQMEEEEEEEEEDVVNDSGRLVQPDAGGSSSGCLKRIPPSMTRGFPFPISSSKPVGRAVEANRNVIWSWLMDDEISIIGIYGMGGIGKTTLLQHIHDELLRRPDISHHVYWVTVPQDFSIYRLQNLIARRLDLDLSSEYDILPRAAKLAEELRKKQEWILILDDLWESFELSTVGIPVPLKKGCKVILTTRSNAICQRMGSQVITKVRPLSEREAWTLFMEKLGHGIALSPEVERIAVDIARECAGLPLGIITMAGSLRGVDDQDEWRNTLEKLKELKSGDMEDVVFRMLRFSYDRLDDKLQQCLLYCALFPEDYIIKREELVFYLIDEGIIQKMWSKEAAYVEGHAMLDRLENAGLLQRIDGGRAVKMHDLVRDMAIRICKENPSVEIKDMAIRICKENPSVKGQRRKGIEMAGSNIDRSNHVEQMNDGGNSTHKTMGKRRKSIEMPLLMTNLILEIASEVFDQLGYALVVIVWAFVALVRDMANLTRKENPSVMGKRRKSIEMPLLMTSLILEMASAVFDQLGYALVGMVLAFVALLLSTADLIHMARRDMVDDFKSGLSGAVSASEQEQNNAVMAQQREPESTGEQEQNNAVMAQQREPESTGEQEQNNDLTEARIDVPPDTPDDPDELKKLKGSESRDMIASGWTLLMTSIILEIASAVFDQLGNALVSMVLAFVALLVATAELIQMERKEKDQSTSTATLPPGKPVLKYRDMVVTCFGFVGAVYQCIYSTVAYAYARQKKDNPIKVSLLTLIFLSCVVISKLKEKIQLMISPEAPQVMSLPEQTAPHDEIASIINHQFVSTRRGGYYKLLVQWKNRPNSESVCLQASELNRLHPQLFTAYRQHNLPESSSSGGAAIDANQEEDAGQDGISVDEDNSIEPNLEGNP